MLQAIRDGSKGTAAKIIVGAIIVTFALFGIDGIVQLGAGEDAPAEVNGEEISEFKISQMVDMQKRRLQSQFGENFDASMFDDKILRQSALEGLINESLLKQAAKESGVYFSNAEIDAIILKSPEFQTNGQFDRDRYDLVLRGAGFTRLTYREVLRNSLMTQQAQVAWQHSSFATASEESRIAKLDAQSRDFSYIEFKLADAKKAAQLSAEEIEAFYADNSDRYMTQEAVVMNYLELTKADIAKTVAVDEEDVQQRYDDMLAEASSKKEYRAAHILLLSSDEAAQASMAQAQAKLKAGTDFAAVAKEFSEDDASKFAGGDLGFSASDVFEDEFSQALLTLAKGQVSDVVETRDGLHLIKLLETRQPEVASLTKLSDSIRTELASEKAQVAYIEALEALKDESFASENLEGPAQSLNLKVQTTQEFSRFGGDELASNKQVLDAAFSEGLLFDGANSDVIELGEGRAIVMHLNKHIESKVKPLAEVTAQIESTLRTQKGSELLEQQLEEALTKAEANELNKSWVSLKDKSRNNKEADSQIVSKIFTMAKGFSIVDLNSGDKALVRLDDIKRDVTIVESDSAKQKASRVKSFNEYKAYYQHFADQASIERN